jgi:hypothetical protein
MVQLVHSHSSLDMYVQCPYKWHQLKVLKAFKDFQGKAGEWGDAVHKALEKRVVDGVPLPPNMQQFEQMAAYISSVPGKKIGEQKLAIKIDGSPTEFWDKTGYLRGMCDLLIVQDDRALLIDYKTGSSAYANNDQATRNALMVFAHYPTVNEIHSRFIYFKDGMTKRAVFSRGEIPQLMRNPGVVSEAIENSFREGNWPKKSSGLCGYCVVATCEHQRKRR